VRRYATRIAPDREVLDTPHLLALLLAKCGQGVPETFGGERFCEVLRGQGEGVYRAQSYRLYPNRQVTGLLPAATWWASTRSTGATFRIAPRILTPLLAALDLSLSMVEDKNEKTS
jgi:hypothetical protein